jgi:hypothetical protein
MVGQTDHFVFSMIMTLFTAGVGGLLMVIGWSKVLLEPPEKVSAKYPLTLYSFTASVCVAIVGSAIAAVLSEDLKVTLWTLSLLASFGCIIASVVLARQSFGPAIRALLLGSIAIFFVDLFCVIGMILALPGMPLNNK